MTTHAPAAPVLLQIEAMDIVSYIFGTNVQREHIGASWLVTQLPRWFASACDSESVDVLVSVSGKLLAKVESAQAAKKIVTAVSCAALDEAPELDICGAWVSLPGDEVTVGDMRRAAVALEEARSLRVSMDAASPTIPFLDVCRVSNRPAVPELGTTGEWARDKKIALSESSRRKRVKAQDFRSHLLKVLENGGISEENATRLLPHLKELEEAADDDSTGITELEWVGVVHADVNHLTSALYGGNAEAVHAVDPRELRERTRQIGQAIESAYVAGAKAVLIQADAASPKKRVNVLPLFPIMLGGDDLTVVVHGHYALTFAVEYAKALRAATAADDSPLRSLTDDHSGFRAAIGVALVKPHFPYHLAAALATALCDRSKQASRAESMVDFEVVYDSVHIDLDGIRGRDPVPSLRPLRVEGVGAGSWCGLVAAARAVVGDGDKDRGMPSGQLAALRDEVRRSGSPPTDPALIDAAAARWSRLAHQYPRSAQSLGDGEGRVVWDDRPSSRRVSQLFDVKALLDVSPVSLVRLLAEGSCGSEGYGR